MRQAARLLIAITLCLTCVASASASDGRQLQSTAGLSAATALRGDGNLPPKVDALLNHVDLPPSMATNSALAGQGLSDQKVCMHAPEGLHSQRGQQHATREKANGKQRDGARRTGSGLVSKPYTPSYAHFGDSTSSVVNLEPQSPATSLCGAGPPESGHHGAAVTGCSGPGARNRTLYFPTI